MSAAEAGDGPLRLSPAALDQQTQWVLAEGYELTGPSAIVYDDDGLAKRR